MALEQFEKFKKVTQQYGSTTVSKEIDDTAQVELGVGMIVDGTANVDFQTSVRTARLVKAYGNQYSDGLYEHYIVQDMRDAVWLENNVVENVIFYNHATTNQFSQLISSDAAIKAKYIVRPLRAYSFGRSGYQRDGNADSYGTITVSNSIMTSGTVSMPGTLDIGSYEFNRWDLYDNNVAIDQSTWGAVNASDVYYVIRNSCYGSDETLREFDFIYELEFKRIIE